MDVITDRGDHTGWAGSAIVVGTAGLLLTAAHLITGPTPTDGGTDGARVWVSDPGGAWTLPARVVGIDDTLDVAVLRIYRVRPLPAVIGDSRTLRDGDQVSAVGNAGGLGPLRAGSGAVLDLGAVIASTEAASAAPLTGLIEIQAGVVAGDSGGAVLNNRGQVVAMILAYAAAPGTANASTGTGYAVPIERVIGAAVRLTTPHSDRRRGRR